MLRVIIWIVVLMSLQQGFGAQGQPVDGSGVEEVYLARDDGKGNAGEQVTEFSVTDIPIYCVVLLESNARSVVKMNFVAVAVAGVKPETKVVTASYTTTNGQNRVNFAGRPVGAWTAGKYRVDLFLDGKLIRNVEFLIKEAPSPIEAKFVQDRSRPKSERPTMPQKP